MKSITEHFATLRLKKGATLAEIKKAYRELASEYHSDVRHNEGKSSDEMMQAINEAYASLGGKENDEREAIKMRNRYRDQYKAHREGQIKSENDSGFTGTSPFYTAEGIKRAGEMVKRDSEARRERTQKEREEWEAKRKMSGFGGNSPEGGN